MMGRLLTFLFASIAMAIFSRDLIGPLQAAEEPSGKPFTAQELLQGRTLSRDECLAITGSLWVDKVKGPPVCLTTFASGKVGESKAAMVFLHGDLLNKQAPGGWAPYPGLEQYSPRSLNAKASSWALSYRGLVILLSRPGTFGSSGSEGKERHTKREAEIINAALDLIKVRHGLALIDIAGQSAGATLAVAMAGLRSDIRCVVSSSGALSVEEAEKLLGTNLPPEYFSLIIDPIKLVQSMGRNREQRVIIINDPRDKFLPSATTSSFIRSLKKSGKTYLHLNAEAAAPAYHALGPEGLWATGACAQGKSDEEIAALVGRKAAD